MSRRLLVVWWTMTGGTRQLVDAFCDGARAEGAVDEASPVGTSAAGSSAAGTDPPGPSAAGTSPASVELVVRRADAAGPDDVLAADAMLFATPENLASMAGRMKDFFDRSYYAVLGRADGRPYASLVCAGTDGEGAARQIARIATGWRMKPAAPPLVVLTHAQTPEAILAPKTIDPAGLARARELGATLAAGLALGIW